MEYTWLVIGGILTFLTVVASYIGLFQQFRKQRKEFENKLMEEVKEKVQFEEKVQSQIKALEMQNENLKKEIDDVKETSEQRGSEVLKRMDRFEDKIDKLSDLIMTLKIGGQ